MNNSAGALRAYQTIGVHSGVEAADPQRLISMLLDGALAQISTAKGHLRRADVARRGECIGRAISIVEGLRVSLDQQAGGDIAANLEALYDYIGRRLLLANARADAAILDEVTALLDEIRMAWEAISAETRAAGVAHGA